jgi:hypothetical protein
MSEEASSGAGWVFRLHHETKRLRPNPDGLAA